MVDHELLNEIHDSDELDTWEDIASAIADAQAAEDEARQALRELEDMQRQEDLEHELAAEGERPDDEED